MSDTDTTHNAPRPSALGDLRLAGTIATGLVAGTLGLGALAAPLVGWKDWTSGLERNVSAPALAMAKPAEQKPNQPNIEKGTGDTGTGSATPQVSVGFPGGGTGSGTAVAVIIGSGDGTTTNTTTDTTAEAERGPRADDSDAGRPSFVTSTPENGKNDSYTTAQANFDQPDLDDPDGDAIGNDVEVKLGTNRQRDRQVRDQRRDRRPDREQPARQGHQR